MNFFDAQPRTELDTINAVFKHYEQRCSMNFGSLRVELGGSGATKLQQR
jgi:hypothetical protein